MGSNFLIIGTIALLAASGAADSFCNSDYKGDLSGYTVLLNEIDLPPGSFSLIVPDKCRESGGMQIGSMVRACGAELAARVTMEDLNNVLIRSQEGAKVFSTVHCQSISEGRHYTQK